jgi:ribonuclease G
LPEWLVERGIGETRAVLVEDGTIVQARVERGDVKPAGSVIIARVVSIGANGRNGLATDEDGHEYLLPRGTGSATQGATINIEVTREPIPGAERWKRPLARVTDKVVGEPPPLIERLGGRAVVFPAPEDTLGELGWNDVIEEARGGIVSFAGGELRLAATPAMTLIDVDGYVAANELALLGASEAARVIRRLDIGGSIGIDLPTVGGKAVRQSAALAIDAVLPQPFERTAVNGFGFVQIVRERSRASLLELAQDRAQFEARILLRRAAFQGSGAIRLVAAPPVIANLEKRPDWLQTLSRQVGGDIGLRADPALPMSGGHAEAA